MEANIMKFLVDFSTALLVLGISAFNPTPCLAGSGWLQKCDQPLGVENGTLIPENRRTISRHNIFEDGPEYARLNRKEQPPGYRAKKNDSMETKSVTVFLDGETIITGIATQGYGDPEVQEWVEEYTLHWVDKTGEKERWVQNPSRGGVVFQGNNDFNTTVRNNFPPIYSAKEVTIKPRKEHKNVGLRFELYGCKGSKEGVTIKCTKKNGGKDVKCAGRAMGGEQLTFEAKLRLSVPNSNNSYLWAVHYLTSSNKWEAVKGYDTRANKRRFIIRADDLKADKNYRVDVRAMVGANDTRRSSYNFTTNGAPRGGRCRPDREKGYALQTEFEFDCKDWTDVDKPLKYEFSYKTTAGLNILITSSNSSRIFTKLGPGDPNNGHRISVTVFVSDSYGATANTSFSVKVVNDNVNLTSKLYKFAVQHDNNIVRLLDEKRLSEAVILANDVLTTMSQADENVQIHDRIKIKNEVIKHMRRANVSDLQGVLLMASVVAGVTEKKDELSAKAQKSSIEILENITRVYTKQSKSPTSDKERMVDRTASNLLHGIGNILEKQGKDAGDRNTNRTEIKINVYRVWTLVNKVGDGVLLKRKTGDEAVKLKTKSMDLLLVRQHPARLEKDPLEVGKNRVSFPPSDVLLKDMSGVTSSVDVQVLTMKANPFAWDASAEGVKSTILSVHLKNGSHGLSISNLSQDIQLNIETGSEPIKQRASFAKPSTAERMQKHVINITSSHMTLQIRLQPESGRSLRMYLRHRLPPTEELYDFQVTIPDYSCGVHIETDHSSEQESTSKPMNCNGDPNLISISSNITGHLGTHYIGIVADDKDTNSNVRARRSCFENGRQKRSADCLQVKDPPTPTPSIIRPTYEPTTDVKYNISVTIATCLYLSENGQWTTEGCKVGNSHASGSLQCLCNHLSSFGGNLLVEPNPIDFDKVWAGFTNMGRDNNVVVITVVAAFFGLWLVVIIFARKADKNDEQKVTPPIILAKKRETDHCYEINISTGVWRRCGTTANVAIIMYGENSETDIIPLTYTSLSNKRLFGRGCINSFILPLKESLGDVGHIRIWHDNTGANPQWFVRQIEIRDIRNDTTWSFVCNRWLAAERDDGKIERVFHASSSEQINSFKNKFWTRTSVGITDGHLWLSVISRLPTSSFTRVQRASCCLCILLTVLVVNAMFYSLEKQQSHTLQLGPFLFSLRQVVIGIQSSFLIVPVNFLIVGIFRNVRPPQDNSNDEHVTSQQGATNTPKSPYPLPHGFLYVGWALCLLTSLSAGAVTVFYSMAWGTETSNQWMVSILVSFSQDVVFIQPVKVIIVATLLSSLIKKAPEHNSLKHLRQCPTSHKEDKVQSVTPPKGPELLRFRQYRIRVLEMSRVIIETVFYLTFAWALMVVCYGSRDTKHFLMTHGLENVFHNKTKPLESVTNRNLFWNWTLTVLIPGLYNTTWYSGQKFEYEEGFISNRVGYMVGMPRLRQLRVKPVPCSIQAQEPDLIRVLHKCLPAYSYQDEDTTKYNSPGWRKFTGNFTRCPKPWLYRDSKDLNNLPYQGRRVWYGGGGYVADLGYTSGAARAVIKRLLDNNWADEHTRAVFIEAMIYEPTNSLFSAVTYLYEVQPTGHGTLTSKIKTMALYAAQASDTQSFYAICELIVFISVIYFLVAQAIKMYRMRCEYLKSVWSWIELAQILVASVTVTLSVFRRYHTSKLVAKIHENPFETSSFHYAIWWSDMENVFMAVLIFIVTVKLLWILKFNQHICRLAGIMKNCSKQLASYAVVYFIAFLAFLQFALLCFGTSVSSFSSVTEALRMQFSLIIGGRVDYDELRLANPVLGSLYSFFFMTIMGTIIINAFLAILNDAYTDARISSLPHPEEQQLLAAFLDYAKKRLSNKLSKLRDRKLLPESKTYDVERARTTDPAPTACKYTELNFLEDANEDPNGDGEDSVLQEVKCHMRSIWFGIHAFRRAKKYEVHRYEMTNLSETIEPHKEKFSFTDTLYQAKAKSISLLNISGTWRKDNTEDTSILFSDDSEGDFEYESTSYAESVTTLLGNASTWQERNEYLN